MGYRLSSTGVVKEADATVFVTGFIPVTKGDTICLDGMIWPLDSKANPCRAYVNYFDSSFAFVNVGVTGLLREDQTSPYTDNWISNGYVETDESGNLTTVRLQPGDISQEKLDTIAYLRISAYLTDAEPIVTVNQEITT